MQDYEKLGVFYLGREYDAAKNQTSPNLLLYDSKDLTTHACCIGMTGSGKTGLCIGLLEEAAIDGIPSIIIDPKGDMTNLLLSFPDFSPSDFKPWINEAEASKKNLSVDEYAQKQADLWKNGLKSWDQDGERIKRFKESADFTIYTPGSSSGTPLSILNSFSAPSKEMLDDEDGFRELVANTATSLLGLLGIDADPINSREHILLSTIFNHLWQKGSNVDLPSLINAIQAPPFERIGVFELDSFFPSKERFELAMSLNNLIASPSFQPWMQGQALDIKNLLYSEDGKPHVSILYIAHLSDTERMFFVSLLLNQMLGWMRAQAGTPSLRAILYFDEVFGYLPPVGNPSSKKPILTLLKQARAFGVGLVLATQNPVDLDYKALSNIGTWFIGRLQTDQDRDRVLDGLSGATNRTFDRKELEQILSKLNKRVFLLHNIHENQAVLFETRWVMSYLCGPLTRSQIKLLTSDANIDKTVKPSLQRVTEPAKEYTALPPDIPQLFMPVEDEALGDSQINYQPNLWGSAEIHYRDSRKGIDFKQEINVTTQFEDNAIVIDWDQSFDEDIKASDLLKSGEDQARFADLPRAATNVKNYKKWGTDFKEYLYRTQKLTLFSSTKYKELSKPDESEQDFRIRLSQLAREQRDEWTEKLREKYEKKINALENRIQRAQDKLDREQDQAKQQKLQTVISVGATLLGAFLGRKVTTQSTLSKTATAARRAGRSMKEQRDVDRAEENVETLQQQLEEVQAEFDDEIASFDRENEPGALELDTTVIRPTKTNIHIELISLVWVPFQELRENSRLV